jgi:hypothetical protein
VRCTLSKADASAKAPADLRELLRKFPRQRRDGAALEADNSVDLAGEERHQWRLCIATATPFSARTLT